MPDSAYEIDWHRFESMLTPSYAELWNAFVAGAPYFGWEGDEWLGLIDRAVGTFDTVQPAGGTKPTWSAEAPPGSWGSVEFADGVNDVVNLGGVEVFEAATALTVSVDCLTRTLAGGSNNLRYTVHRSSGTAASADEFMIRLNTASDRFEFFVGGTAYVGAVGPTSSVAVDTWYNVTGVYDGANVHLYVDGILLDSTAKTGAVGNSSVSMLIGAQDKAADTREWAGNITNVFLLPGVAWDDGQVMTHYLDVRGGFKSFGQQRGGGNEALESAAGIKTLPLIGVGR